MSSGEQSHPMAGVTAITNARIFDGEKVISARHIIIQEGTIIAVGERFRHMRP
ncbi:hypothetical protein [Paenibacillus sonchi]|uniref:hypothetical protein n=1 Tax=Paenibacillus sonchi TaxID=373687 RepID=UPI001F41F6AF|nr:hypothetical protein [Paenibacillus sonchi]